MKLTPKIQFIQNRCIESAHPGLSMEDALVAEVSLGSMVESHGKIYRGSISTMGDNTNVFGLPLCLARVLNGLGSNKYIYHDGMIKIREEDEDGDYWQQICMRKLLNSDGSPATLFDQTDETIKKIANEMGYKSD